MRNVGDIYYSYICPVNDVISPDNQRLQIKVKRSTLSCISTFYVSLIIDFMMMLFLLLYVTSFIT